MTFPYKLVDLTHPLTANMPSWDNSCGFNHTTLLDYADCTSEVKFRVQGINMPAGIGTHMDAPAHCDSQGKTIDAISLQDCLAPCVVIDISEKAHETYLCSMQDILNFKKQYRPIHSGDFVIIHTGWSRHWLTPAQYRNNLQFPSVSREAAQLLVERNIAGLGIDTLGPDTAESGYPVHQIILNHGKYLVENVANADLLPPIGSTILVAPLYILGGTEAPVRLIGFIERSRESRDDG
ncbi:TPA: cyclase family protein [Legionella pneumophila]|nr:cyclase family protein [Legionella pneumophila]HAT8257820.1 cyclase family protein [Legionella pneumophila]HAT8260554.1 cyclase family protein [Legionella pneumophila]HAT8270160.1 cyclase family protein [Legionella pneumophila]HAT8273099.1 cyclase family protein [Legionella pneumophila]